MFAMGLLTCPIASSVMPCGCVWRWFLCVKSWLPADATLGVLAQSNRFSLPAKELASWVAARHDESIC